MNFKVSQLKSLSAAEVSVDDLIYIIDSNPTDGSVKSKKVTVGDLIDSRIYGINSSQFVLITGYYANPSWILSLDWSKITNAPSFVTSLSALTDVTISALNSNQLLRYDGVSWKNWTPTYYSLPAGGTTLQYLDGTGALQTFPTSLPTSTVRHQVKAGVPITKGQAVYVTSADGTNMIVGLASNTSEATSSKTMGLLDTTVSTNGFANVVTEGLLAGLDTTGANAAGDPVWLGTNGNLIYGLVNKPYAPNHLVFIGIVTRKNANNGEIFIKPQNGFELQELHNVDALNPSNNDGIFYNSTTQLWEHKQISAVAPTPTLAQVTTAGNTTTNNITIGTLYFGNGNHYLVTDNGSYAMLSSNRTLQLATSGNPVLSVFTSQNVAIGTTTDSGFKLDVNGSQRILGNLTITAGGSGTNTFNANVNYLFANQNNVYGIVDLQNAAGQSELLKVTATYSYSSGTGNQFIISSRPTYNFTGTFTGIVRGYYYNPTLTSLTGTTHRAIETTSGDVIFNGGQVGIGTTSPTGRNGYGGGTLVEIVNNTAYASLNLNGGNTSAPTYLTLGAQGSGADIRVNNKSLLFTINSIDALKIATTGNVGVNTTTDSGYKLDVIGYGRFKVAGTGVTTALRIENGTNSSAVNLELVGGPLASTAASVILQGTDLGNWAQGLTLKIYDGTFGGSGSMLDRYVFAKDYLNLLSVNQIKQTGTGAIDNIWISTGSDVLNSVSGISLSLYKKAAIYQIVSTSALYGVGDIAFAINNTTTSAVAVSTSDEKMRLTRLGNLLVGTTTDTGYKLDVNGTARFVSAVTFNNSATNTSGGFVHSSSSPSNDAFYTLYLGSVRFYVRSDGYCKTTTSIVTNGVGSVDASAISQIDSTTKGFLPPRMTTTQILAIASPAEGLQVYNTDLKTICFYNGTAWQRVTSTAM